MDTEAACASIAEQAGSPLAFYNLGTVFFQAGDHHRASIYYSRALQLDPDLIEANHNMAAILEMDGRHDEAHHFRDRALRQRCLFIDPAPAEQYRVLLLAASAFGNVPIEDLLPRQTVTRMKLFVEYATQADGSSLPAHDAVFNAIGDADIAEPLLAHLQKILDCTDAPILNRPAAVALTQRHKLAATLASIADIVVPRTILLRPGDEPRRFATGACLLRPIGSHGGAGVVRALCAADLPATIEAPHFLTDFHDYQSPDGTWRKYRMIFVDRKPYPYHLAISDHWLVHYFSAHMLADPAKRSLEELFLADPQQYIGEAAMRAITAVGARLDLDFAGIDFALLPDGRVLVFEANATMLVHLHESIEDFPYKHRYVPQIFSAFNDMLHNRITAARPPPR
jgi:tetratricopeptide (TPR) repeat protein